MADQTTQQDNTGSEHYVSPRQKRARPKATMQPPLTPMIDVTFQLLFFFLITMTFRQNEGMIPGSLPERGMGVATIDPLKESITVRLQADGEDGKDVIFKIDGQVMTNGEELLGFFKERIKLLGAATDSPIVIAPQGDVRWQWVVEAFNQANAAEFKEIGFAPAPG